MLAQETREDVVRRRADRRDGDAPDLAEPGTTHLIGGALGLGEEAASFGEEEAASGSESHLPARAIE